MFNRLLSPIILILLLIPMAFAQDEEVIEEEELRFIIFWEGTDPIMKFSELAAYCAPIFWYSPDEPELKNLSGKNIRIPAAFPFEEQVDAPVVYYQIRKILIRDELQEDALNVYTSQIDSSTIDLSKVAGFDIDYNHYYRYEVGLGKHNHDTEQAQFKVYVHHYEGLSGETRYQLYLIQATAKAHALMWYDNIYKLDTDNYNYELHLPFHILVEEGKHASVSDMNGDGYYTPGYDVNVRTNDAWGLRDVIRTGALFSPRFEAWMAKVRRPEHQVFPPLPDDSPHRNKLSENGVYAPYNAIYKLRPMPSYEAALPDEALSHDMESYYAENWPTYKSISNTQKFMDWWDAENFIKSVAFAFRANNNKIGLSINFPLFIVKNVEAPLIGGWLVNRIYLQGENLRDFGYNILYTPSASRFLDPYFALGFEVEKFDVTDASGISTVNSKTDFVFETGIKLRGNVKYSPLKFLTVLSDFWGVRFGFKNKGYMKINEITYVIEIGAGVW